MGDRHAFYSCRRDLDDTPSGCIPTPTLDILDPFHKSYRRPGLFNASLPGLDMVSGAIAASISAYDGKLWLGRPEGSQGLRLWLPTLYAAGTYK